MKHLIFILLTILFLNSCAPDKKPVKQDLIPFLQQKEKKLETPIKNSSATSIKTRTDKTFVVNEERISASLNKTSIETNGFTEKNDIFRLGETDPIYDIIISDLDKNGFDELFIITRSVGTGSYGTIYGFSSNKDRSVSSIIIPEISQSDLAEDAIFNGYMGHDSIYVSNYRLFRKFPVYKDGDENCCPTGGDRTIQYKLKHGEDMWRLDVMN
jgi:hypothetical protein